MVDISGQPELAAAKACGGKSNKSRLVKVGNTGSKSGGNQINVCLLSNQKIFNNQKELFRFEFLGKKLTIWWQNLE